jgi:hypothetical protein
LYLHWTSLLFPIFEAMRVHDRSPNRDTSPKSVCSSVRDHGNLLIVGSNPRYHRWLHWLLDLPFPTNREIAVQFSIPNL